jgi:hypothetical protein
MASADVKLIKSKIHELASQVFVLATGLQNAAPAGGGGKSVQYLLETASQLEKINKDIESLIILKSKKTNGA